MRRSVVVFDGILVFFRETVSHPLILFKLSICVPKGDEWLLLQQSVIKLCVFALYLLDLSFPVGDVERSHAL